MVFIKRFVVRSALLFQVLIATVIPSFTLAQRGEKDGGGGDPGAISAHLKKEQLAVSTHAFILWFSTGAQNMFAPPYISFLASTIGSIDPNQISDPSSRAIFSDLLARGLVEDVRKTKIALKDECVIWQSGKKTLVTAGTLMNEPGSEICIDPYRFVEALGSDLKQSVLLGLMVHEFAHHFGYRDLDHKLAMDVARSLELQNQSDDLDASILRTHLKFVRQMHVQDAEMPYIKYWQRCATERNCFTPKFEKNSVRPF